MPKDREKNCYIQKEGRFITYTRNCEQKTNVAVLKSALQIPPRHNGIMLIKIKGHMAYFIQDKSQFAQNETTIGTTPLTMIYYRYWRFSTSFTKNLIQWQ